MQRLSTISLLLAVGGYGIMYYGYTLFESAGISFGDIWSPAPATRAKVVQALLNGRSATLAAKNQAAAQTSGATGTASGQTVATTTSIQTLAA